MAKRLVEVLSFEGCPHGEPALELAARVIREAGVEAELRRVDVTDPETAVQQRFLGSPTIRVDGRDIEHAELAMGEAHAGRRTVVAECRVDGSDGRLVATASATFAVTRDKE